MTVSADVVVVGAGPAGIAAAVTAARTGRSTLLLEKETFAGGIPVKGRFSTLCGLYPGGSGSGRPQILYDGFPWEFARLLMHSDGVEVPVRMGRANVLLYRPESYAAAVSGILESEPALTVRYGCSFSAAWVKSGRIRGIDAVCSGRRFRITPGAVIDASGDAAVVRAADAPVILPDEAAQVPAVVFPLLHGGAPGFSVADAARWHRMIRNALKNGILPEAAASVRFLPVPDSGEVLVKLNLGRFIRGDSRLPEKKLEKRADELKQQIVRFFRNKVPGFEKCTSLGRISPVLHRESVRGKGKYVLSGEEVLSGQRFPDAVAKGCWPVEKWDENDNFSVYYVTGGRYYEIPGGALKSPAIDNLFMAGKCISADSAAIASARAIACCMATGEAAAGLAVQESKPGPSGVGRPRESSVKPLDKPDSPEV